MCHAPSSLPLLLIIAFDKLCLKRARFFNSIAYGKDKEIEFKRWRPMLEGICASRHEEEGRERSTQLRAAEEEEKGRLGQKPTVSPTALSAW